MIELTLDNFDEEVINNSKPVLVDWWGESCENCIALMPAVEELAEQYDDNIHFTKFNTSQKKVRRFCIKHKILGLPVISIFKNGEKVDEITQDDCTKENIESMIKRNI
ncbi:thioredoxin TrxA [Vagococcus elongatus]|uniref:Thiol reductase thioredoxin n=1 Tax=Vagococcus elongatus TaxID=180344 RepID=A0A430B611_9ENTE|nr:thioredoxin domain-containing protein [Vagococcus elongatus]RSU15743.1 thiol reductase thioredoxin [Vagococcus elongatus]